MVPFGASTLAAIATCVSIVVVFVSREQVRCMNPASVSFTEPVQPQRPVQPNASVPRRRRGVFDDTAVRECLEFMRGVWPALNLRTDKFFNTHQYQMPYCALLAPLRHEPLRMLEVGLGCGKDGAAGGYGARAWLA